MTRTAVCCLWEGHDLPAYSAHQYDSHYVANLARGLGPDVELVCYVDGAPGPAFEDVADWRTFKYEHRGGWSRRLEPFAPENRPRGSERHVLLDLDTIIVGNCDWLWEWDKADVGCPLDPYFTGEICSTVISYNEAGAELVWDAYLASDMMELNFARGCYSEMVLLRTLQKQEKWPPLEEPKGQRLRSFKVDVPTKGWGDGCSLVFAHGNPKPHNLPDSHGLKAIWEG